MSDVNNIKPFCKCKPPDIVYLGEVFHRFARNKNRYFKIFKRIYKCINCQEQLAIFDLKQQKPQYDE
jgi:hypothetical protein